MFLGAIEVEREFVYASENALQHKFSDNDIVIIENHYILHSLESDKPVFKTPHFICTNWSTIKMMSKERIIQGLVFTPMTTDTEIQNFLKQRVQYFYSLYNQQILLINIKTDKNNIIVNTVTEPVS